MNEPKKKKRTKKSSNAKTDVPHQPVTVILFVYHGDVSNVGKEISKGMKDAARDPGLLDALAYAFTRVAQSPPPPPPPPAEGNDSDAR